MFIASVPSGNDVMKTDWQHSQYRRPAAIDDSYVVRSHCWQAGKMWVQNILYTSYMLPGVVLNTNPYMLLGISRL